MNIEDKKHHVVIVGGGFGGLYAAKKLAKAPVRVTLIDKRNFHLFQPLLYQVATAGLSPGDIASPLRRILGKYKNISVLQAEVTGINPSTQTLTLPDGEISYDSLIIATGASHHYFGKADAWADKAPGLKTIEDALDIRQRILRSFEAAERETDPEKRQAWLTFVIVGAGPTGVELAGALGELAHKTLVGEFRNVDLSKVKIVLMEGAEKVLPPYPQALSEQAKQSLLGLGVTIETGALVTDIQENGVMVKQGQISQFLPARTVLWAAGMQASPLGQVIAQQTGAKLDRAGRVKVHGDLSVGDYDNVFVIGDLAHFASADGSPLPGVAQVAMQQGSYVAKLIQKRLKGGSLPQFKYQDRGSMAVIGRNAAVVNMNFLQFWGFPAWLVWVFIHIAYLIEFDNRLLVLFQWAINYFTHKRGVRLITRPVPAGGQAGTSDLRVTRTSEAVGQ
jgi:NADH dehydrogenase